jgi:hypothetical protein
MGLKVPKSRQFGRAVTHTRAPKQEKSRAATLKGRTVKGSGSGHEKGDVRIEKVIRLECKNTIHKSFSVTQKMIEKIENAALASGELPAIEVEFVDAEGKLKHRVAILPSYALEMLIG